MGRRDEIIALLAQVNLPLDDDDIGDRLGIDRHHVNSICRDLVSEGLATRSEGPDGKLRTHLGVPPGDVEAPSDSTPPRRPRLRRADLARQNVESLVATFGDCVARFETSNAFPGPSLYFHDRAIECRREARDASSLLADTRFLEYVYAVLPAWGMHRMGKQTAKVVDFGEFASSLQQDAGQIQALWNRDITAITDEDVSDTSARVWEIISTLRVSRSRTHIVAGSKALHHVLPDLVPPIDRQYTFQFFTGQKSVQHGEAAAFAEWFPLLCEIGSRCRAEIEQIQVGGGFMATSSAKIIDNAIIGFMQGLARG